MTDIQILTNAILEAGVDIAPDYRDYFHLCMSIVDSCHEEGRPFFHRICELNPSYDFKKADNMYSYCLKHSQGKHTLGTAVSLALKAGVKAEALKFGKNSSFCQFATEGGYPKFHTRV